jgi:hypothetical protein
MLSVCLVVAYKLQLQLHRSKTCVTLCCSNPYLGKLRRDLASAAAQRTWIAVCCQEEVSIPLVNPVSPAVCQALINFRAT